MKLPAALLVAGTDGHRRRVFVRDFVTKCVKAGYTPHPLDGADREGLQTLVSTVGVLFPNPTLAVIQRPEKVVADDVTEHLRSPNPYLVLLFVSEQDKPSGGALDGFPAAHTKTFSLPPFYKLDDHAADYACEVAKSRGVDLSERLARALVKAVGNDLGVLTYEVSKAVMLVRSLGVKVVEPSHLRATLAPLMELDGSNVLDALGTRGARAISDELSRYRNSKRSDPTIELCGRTLTPAVLRWMQAVTMQSGGMSVASAAARVGANPWYWEHKILPAARAWGVAGCRALLGVIAHAQTAVFEGAIRPWIFLESGILRLAR